MCHCAAVLSLRHIKTAAHLPAIVLFIAAVPGVGIRPSHRPPPSVLHHGRRSSQWKRS